MPNFNKLIGKKIKGVNLSNDKERFAIHLEDKTVVYGVEGDCCSQSWIEHLEMPKDIEGAIIVSVKDSPGVPWDGHECRGMTPPEQYLHDCGHEHLQVYETRFRTDRGDVVLEYRNDSNGYYGGYLVEEQARV